VDVLWSPWRYDYIKSGAGDVTNRPHDCVFCGILQSEGGDGSKFILSRATYNFVILNIYPYITGHLMVVPYQHVAELADASKEITDEMMDLTKQCQAIVKQVYSPHGFNLGMNLGRAAGAGVAGHIHLHLMPRWQGDANFTTTIGETRVIPESLHTTYEKLRPWFHT
jgi:ATP adenylyltransferase